MKIGSIFATAAMLVSVSWGAAAAAEVAAPQAIVCHPIRQPAQLLNINNDPAASYCLLRDIDAAELGVLPDSPIPTFTGRFFGNGHAIRNLTIDSSGADVGLFGVVDNALIQDVRLVNVDVSGGGGNDTVGGLASTVTNASTIARVAVSGRIGCTGSCIAGGIVGRLEDESTLTESSSAAAVAAPAAFSAGGAVAQVLLGASIIRTHATGSVNGVNSGGLVGLNGGLVDLSSASGRVGGGDSGGLVGILNGGIVRRSHASGPVSGVDAGGLVGSTLDGTIEQSYAVGRVTGGVDAGGLVGSDSGGTNTGTNAYWDTVTTRQATSADGLGTGLATGALRSALPAGFGSDWGITRNKSYPFLDDPDISLILPLATLARGRRVYTFVPIGQNEASQYAALPQNERLASLAAVYTMIARAIGTTRDIADLQNATITDFWDDNTATATWQGPVTTRATLGPLMDVPPGANLGHGNVIDEIRRRNLVILRGSYTAPNGNVRTHWMLATLYAPQPNGKPGLLVANDPWTGAQVFIDRTSKQVVLPADFPLADFRIDGYQPVTVQ